MDIKETGAKDTNMSKLKCVGHIVIMENTTRGPRDGQTELPVHTIECVIDRGQAGF